MDPAQEATFSGRVGLQQRVLPAYRVPFFERLAVVCEGGLQVFAGEPRRDEAILQAAELRPDLFSRAKNIHILNGTLYLCYQENILSWLRAWDPQVLILEANPRYLANWRALHWMRKRNRPLIGWGLGAPPPGGALAQARRAFRSRFFGNFDALIAYSTLGAEQYRLSGVPEERLFVAPNAVAAVPPPLMPRKVISWDDLHVLFVAVCRRANAWIIYCKLVRRWRSRRH